MPDSPAQRIDALMKQASTALVARRYFECERLASDALQIAFGAADYERMARILLPLQEARRQKRDLALDAGRVFQITGDLPLPGETQPGCYLIAPPRVGLDGRLLREQADRDGVPVVVVVREPLTRSGHWPIVALGPVTLRLKIDPPGPEHLARPATKKSRTKGAARKGGDESPEPGAGAATSTLADDLPPGVHPLPAWFVLANEALGDAAIASVDPSRALDVQIDELYQRLQAHPDHEKLHQRLREVCERAAQIGAKPAARSRPRFEDDDDASDLDA